MKNTITWFYWQLDKNENVMNRLKHCSSFDEIGRVRIVPVSEEKLSSSLNEKDCTLFQVEVNYDRHEVLLSYYFKAASTYITKPYISELDESEPLFFRTMVFCAGEGAHGILEPEDTFEVPDSFSPVPKEVREYCFNEIKKMERAAKNTSFVLGKKEFDRIFKPVTKERNGFPEVIDSWKFVQSASEDSVVYIKHNVLCIISKSPDGSWKRCYGTSSPVGALLKTETVKTREEALSNLSWRK